MYRFIKRYYRFIFLTDSEEKLRKNVYVNEKLVSEHYEVSVPKQKNKE